MERKEWFSFASRPHLTSSKNCWHMLIEADNGSNADQLIRRVSYKKPWPIIRYTGLYGHVFPDHRRGCWSATWNASIETLHPADLENLTRTISHRSSRHMSCQTSWHAASVWLILKLKASDLQRKSLLSRSGIPAEEFRTLAKTWDMIWREAGRRCDLFSRCSGKKDQ
jgi:hypothetical protein